MDYSASPIDCKPTPNHRLDKQQNADRATLGATRDTYPQACPDIFVWLDIWRVLGLPTWAEVAVARRMALTVAHQKELVVGIRTLPLKFCTNTRKTLARTFADAHVVLTS